MKFDIFKKLGAFRKEEEGASMVEYGLALLVAVIVGVTAMQNLGTNTQQNVKAACGAIQVTGANAPAGYVTC